MRTQAESSNSENQVRPINRLLIANRGEIAIRIATTAHRLGMSTVAVYSEPDKNAAHVDAADVAISLGGQTAAESYLNGEAIIAAARSEGCDAIHPGYGFLAESAEFAGQVTEAGLIWVGPTPSNIELLGNKVAAKEAAVAAGVPTTGVIPVAVGNIPDDVPMPALVKAAAGGGGRGMRIVREPADLEEAVASAAREAEAAFADPSVFIEPFIQDGRHIEIQIMADKHGNVIHLGDRECSIQRRNQKIIEESPSAGISDRVRNQLTQAALDLARSVGYENAGTVEFLVGEDETITFLEVNTRLQVEHPVTEMVTGQDLVELQLLVASGERLPLVQDDVVISGHAIEVRIVAEDPAQGWLPSTGMITTFDLETDDGVRVDSGFRSGGEVSPDYDSLMAKVVAYAPSRILAAKQLARALRGSRISGVRSNIACLVAILEEADFLSAKTPTSYLDTHPEVAQAQGPRGPDQVAQLLAAVFALEVRDRTHDLLTGFAPSGWRNLRTQGQRVVLDLADEEHPVEFTRTEEGATALLGPWPTPTADGTLSNDDRQSVAVRLLDQQLDRVVLEVDGRRSIIAVDMEIRAGEVTTVHTSNRVWRPVLDSSCSLPNTRHRPGWYWSHQPSPRDCHCGACRTG